MYCYLKKPKFRTLQMIDKKFESSTNIPMQNARCHVRGNVLPYQNREQDNEFVIPPGILSLYQQLDLVEEISDDALHIADGQACSLSLVDMS